MNYKVLHLFKEKEHGDTIYSIGDPYPKEGFKANDKRVSFLQELNPVYGVRFLDSAEDKPTVKKKKSDAK